MNGLFSFISEYEKSYSFIISDDYKVNFHV